MLLLIKVRMVDSFVDYWQIIHINKDKLTFSVINEMSTRNWSNLKQYFLFNK